MKILLPKWKFWISKWTILFANRLVICVWNLWQKKTRATLSLMQVCSDWPDNHVISFPQWTQIFFFAFPFSKSTTTLSLSFHSQLVFHSFHCRFFLKLEDFFRRTELFLWEFSLPRSISARVNAFIFWWD